MTTNTVSSCKAEILHYTETIIKEVSFGGTVNTDVEEITIDKECLSFEYTKSIGAIAGSFTLQVTADVNWKKRVFVDDWILVYLSNEGEKHLRMIGNIDRVSQFTTRNDEGLLETSYVILGRDFGKVFEETDIWFNPLDMVNIFLGGVLKSRLPLGSPNEFINEFLDVCLGGKISDDNLRKHPQLNQWIIPKALVTKIRKNSGTKIPSSISSITGGKSRFYDVLEKDIQKVSGKKSVNVSTIQGNLWGILKRYNNDIMNEMFLEMYNGKPTIVFRTKPLARSGYKFGSITSEVKYFDDLPRVIVKGEDIVGTDIGYSSEDRYNYFLMTSSADIMGVNKLTTNLKPDFPDIQEASIQRNGLRKMHVDTDHALLQMYGKNLKHNPNLLKEWNKLLKHWFNNFIFMEAGTIDLVKANPDLKVGVNLVIDDATINDKKIFYVEGYTDSWSYPGNWHQTVELTMGKVLNKAGLIRYTFTSDDAEKVYTGQTVIERE